MPYYRKITVDDKIFDYHISRSGIKIRSKPAYFLPMTDATGWSWDALERANYKGYPPEITPSDIANWIRENKLVPHEKSVRPS